MVFFLLVFCIFIPVFIVGAPSDHHHPPPPPVNTPPPMTTTPSNDHHPTPSNDPPPNDQSSSHLFIVVTPPPPMTPPPKWPHPPNDPPHDHPPPQWPQSSSPPVSMSSLAEQHCCRSLNKVHVPLFTKWKLSLIGWNGCYHKQNNLLKQSKSNFQSWLSQLDIFQVITACPQGNGCCEANNCPRVPTLVSAESSLAAPSDALPNSKVSKSTYSGFCQQQTQMIIQLKNVFETGLLLRDAIMWDTFEGCFEIWMIFFHSASGPGQGKVNIRSKIWNIVKWLPICLILRPKFQGVQDNKK